MWTLISKLQLAKISTHSLLRDVSRSNSPPIRLPCQPEPIQKICLFGKEIGKYRLGLGTFLLLINSKACYMERRTWVFALQYIHFYEKVTKYLSLEVLLTGKMNKIGNADAHFRKVKIFLVN